jgi:ribonuclease P protein component
VVHLPGAPHEAARVAYAVPKRVGTAVVRNRLRRRLRAIVADLDRHGRLPGGAWLLVAAPPLVRTSPDELRMTVERAITRIRERA